LQQKYLQHISAARTSRFESLKEYVLVIVIVSCGKTSCNSSSLKMKGSFEERIPHNGALE
jgi:hypothetical protein